MIVLDTHVWVWWVHGDAQIQPSQSSAIEEAESDVIGVSAISCWEVAKLVERGRLVLPRPPEEWIASALHYPGIRLIGLSPEIAVASARLPGSFHRDPADQIIVATARVNGCSLVTSDQKIISYEHVERVSRLANGALAADLAHGAVARLLGEGEAGGGLDPCGLPQDLVDRRDRVFASDSILYGDIQVR